MSSSTPAPESQRQKYALTIVRELIVFVLGIAAAVAVQLYVAAAKEKAALTTIFSELQTTTRWYEGQDDGKVLDIVKGKGISDFTCPLTAEVISAASAPGKTPAKFPMFDDKQFEGLARTQREIAEDLKALDPELAMNVAVVYGDGTRVVTNLKMINQLATFQSQLYALCEANDAGHDWHREATALKGEIAEKLGITE